MGGALDAAGLMENGLRRLIAAGASKVYAPDGAGLAHRLGEIGLL